MRDPFAQAQIAARKADEKALRATIVREVGEAVAPLLQARTLPAHRQHVLRTLAELVHREGAASFGDLFNVGLFGRLSRHTLGDSRSMAREVAERAPEGIRS